MSDAEIKKLIKERRKDKEEKLRAEADLQLETGLKFQENGLGMDGAPAKDAGGDSDVTGVKMDNRAKHSEESSKQPGKNGDKRSKNPKKKKDDEEA